MNIVSNMAVFSSQRLIFGLPVCDLDWSETFLFVNALADMPIGQTTISFLNAHNANLMLSDSGFRDVLTRHLVLPDGVGIDFASLARYGKRFPANLNGTDFVPGLMTYISRPKRVGLVGARADVLEKAREGFARHAPWHEFIAIHDGYFRDEDSRSVVDKIAAAKVDILLVAMGTPKQEKWIDLNIRPEHARLVIGVGALFDFMGGEVPRAPEPIRSMRLEWLYRVVQEPRRLAGRYFMGGPIFVARALGHAISERAIASFKTHKRDRRRVVSLTVRRADRRRA
jgi:exopolysaccharide biosynthesis WecB/TagA/CpsF family protein